MAPASTASATASCLVRRQTLEDRDGRVARAVRLAQAGDPEAIAFLYQRYAGNICGYVYSIVGDEHEADTGSASTWSAAEARATHRP